MASQTALVSDMRSQNDISGHYHSLLATTASRGIGSQVEMESSVSELKVFHNPDPASGLPGTETRPWSHLPKPVIKEEQDDESVSTGGDLLSLKSEDGTRGSPNSSMTSASTSIVSKSDVKGPSTPKSAQKTEILTEETSPFQQARLTAKFRARSSIPARLQPAEYAKQCIGAAHASRLDPYALHPDEHRLLHNHLCHLHVTVYLNIRNGILRLWLRNPSVSVNLEEAIGCAKDERWTQLACFAYEWLVRKGYINFGCVEVPPGVKSRGRRKESARPTIVVVGGGMAGLSCARQLTSVYQNYPNHVPPRVVVLEGRSRIGGRIYSHPLSSQPSHILEPHQRPTAEMGAHIIVGFEHGNPLDAIIRGQLALKYHSLRDLSTLYDVDGTAVDENQDTMVERLYNDILDRSGQFRVKSQSKKTAEGDKELIDSGRDPVTEDALTISQFEEASASGAIDLFLPTKSRRRGAGHRAAKADNPDEKVDTNMDTQTQLPAARAAREIGFAVRSATKMTESLHLDELASVPNQSLGTILDAGVSQYQAFLDLKPKALRLLNWHFANLEYANAASVDKLSLGGWDQDIGNEFEGEHAQVVGGYQQLPRALWRYPEMLDVRTNKVVNKIQYEQDGSKAKITCEDGDTFEADKIVFSAPLGVLKQDSITFDPPLPDWKQGAISRMGFGLLNKIILVFDQPFWDINRDMFGLLRTSRYGSGTKQEDYRTGRGQFYLFWNCLQTSGLPVLIALMAGDAAHEAERTPDQELVSQCVAQLRNVFGPSSVPTPTETIVTRWGSDRFARGTYSFVAAGAQPNDYDLLAQPIGSNLFFAGEATCGTHPATVHGAYLSGLRAASEVLDSLIGPIALPHPLVPHLSTKTSSKRTSSSSSTDLTTISSEPPSQKRKGDPILPSGTFTRPVKPPPPSAQLKSLQEAWDAAMWIRIYDDLGPPPVRPAKTGLNPFLLFQKARWNEVKERLDAEKAQSGKKDAKAGRDEVRIELGRMWKALPDTDRGDGGEGGGKASFIEETRRNKEVMEQEMREWVAKAAEWDRRTWEVKDVWIKEGNAFEEWCRRREMGREGEVGDKRIKVGEE